MRCPVCGDEYRDDVTRCADCGVELVADGELAEPRADAVLGTFHPALADRLLALLAHRGIVAEQRSVDPDAVELRVDRLYRDDLRAELVVSWDGLLQRLDRDVLYEVLARGGRLPGWDDPPTSTWVDREGRMQVGGDAAEERAAEERRVLGPSLVVLGAVLLLFGWYADAGAGAIVVGLAAALLGAFLPR